MNKLFNLKKLGLISFFICSLLFQSVAYARWAVPEDTEISLDLYNRSVDIRKDGTFTETIEIMMEATKEGGKDRLVAYPIIYNKSSTELKILEAKTLCQGKEYPVDPKKMEDKPLASSPQGFDQKHQVLIAFPNMAVNAKAYLKYRLVVKEAAVPNFFATDFIFGAGEYYKSSKVKVNSEVPFYTKIQDPENYLEVKQSSDKAPYTMEITLKRPVIKIVIEEQYTSMGNENYPWVTISTLKEWPQLGQLLYKKYEAVVNQKLPELFEKIAVEAQSKPILIEKINTVTARLAENLTYMGDWITVKGQYTPRNLAEINSTRYGDCKDFSASTAAILRRIDVKADTALVFRQNFYYESPHNLPKIHDFNHVIVRVKDAGKTVWVDPTNSSSFAQGIYPDIEQRKSLVLDPNKPDIEMTSTLASKDSQTVLKRKLVLLKDEPDMAYVEGQISLIGAEAIPFTGASLNASKETISHYIISSLTDESRTESWKVEDFDLTSRIVKDLDFKYNYKVRHDQLKTTAGHGYMLAMPEMVRTFLMKTKDRVSDLMLETPSTRRKDLLISKTALLGNQNLNCSLDSPWLKATRTIQDSPEGIHAIDEFEVKKAKIPNAELKSAEFAKFQNQLYNCFGDTALIYKSQ